MALIQNGEIKLSKENGDNGDQVNDEFPSILTYSSCNLATYSNRIEDMNFDNILKNKWNKMMKSGFFRYNTDTNIERVLSGDFHYLAQYQPNRAKLRRPPQAMQHLSQPFNKDKFNFNKIDESKELVFQLKNKDSIGSENDPRDILIINVSPIDIGHCLLVPKVEECSPQVLTPHACQLAMEVMFLSSSPDIRLAFNSLCAFASVNHLHWHLYYLTHKCPVQTLPLANTDNDSLYILTSKYPAPAWVVLVNHPDQIVRAAYQVSKITEWLTSKDVAHNVFIAKGTGVKGGDGIDVVRVVIWPRESIRGAKDAGQFVMAVCELSGQVLVYEKEKFDNIEEDEVVLAQRETAGNILGDLHADVLKLLQ